MNNTRKIFALGFFDGVHRGHQQLLEECCRLAAAQNALPAAITFDQHPKALYTTAFPPLINSITDRVTLLRHFGIHEIQVLPVSRETMAKSWRSFLQELLAQGACGFVCGDDFRFGHKGIGNTEKLQAFCGENGLPCIIVQEQTWDGVRISSTRIRRLLEAGDMETAAAFLGHRHILSGEVVHGRQLGRTIGVPTANILLPEGVMIPKLGVYACTCDIDGHRYVTVTNIGSRPTVGGHQTRAESWILDYVGDLYGRTITLQFHAFLRPEQTFGSLEELKVQIQTDAAKAALLLG